MQAALLLVVVSVLGAALPLYRRWSERGLHLFVAVAAGIFLGAIFLHLLPELATGSDARGPWIAALAGLLLLFFIEKIWLAQPAKHADPHDVVWFATFIGLSVHSFATGLGCGGMAAQPAVFWPLVGSIAVHKLGEAFSLATVMRLGGLGTGRAIAFLAVFCLVAPVALVAGAALAISPSTGGLPAILTGLACGTFLYVAVGDLLPEVFHGTEARGQRVAGLLLGIAVAAAGMAGMS
ncbi:MAG: ZIP family metal transporter [Planctomycetota bacterium]